MKALTDFHVGDLLLADGPFLLHDPRDFTRLISIRKGEVFLFLELVAPFNVVNTLRLSTGENLMFPQNLKVPVSVL